MSMSTSWAQDDSTQLLRELDSLSLTINDSVINAIYQDTIHWKDTLTPEKFVGYDRQIFKASKANLRKSLLESENPPKRINLNNWDIFIWSLVILLMIIFFKSNYPLQYRLLNKAWYSHISFNEFFDTQTAVFKNSKLLTWLIISQCLSLGTYIALKSSGLSLQFSSVWYAPLELIRTTPNYGIDSNDFQEIVIISVLVTLLFTANQWLKNVFAFAFYQPGLNRDYAIIFRIQAYIISLVLLPILVTIYYNGSRNMNLVITTILIFFIIVVYVISLIKFLFSGRFLQNQSNFILFLYLCAFEILPLFVLVKSITSLLEYD